MAGVVAKSIGFIDDKVLDPSLVSGGPPKTLSSFLISLSIRQRILIQKASCLLQFYSFVVSFESETSVHGEKNHTFLRQRPSWP